MKSVFVIACILLIGYSNPGVCQSGRDVHTVDPSFRLVMPMEAENILVLAPITPDADLSIEPFLAELPGVRMMSMDDVEFIDLHDAACLVSVIGENTFSIAHDGEEAFYFQVESGFRLPDILKDKMEQAVTVSLRSMNTAAGADEMLRLFARDTLVMGYLWQTSRDPLSMTGHESQPLIRQVSLAHPSSEKTEGGVRVQMMDDSGARDVPLREFVTFTNRGIRYQAYVILSAYIYEDNDGYLLHAVIMRD